MLLALDRPDFSADVGPFNAVNVRGAFVQIFLSKVRIIVVKCNFVPDRVEFDPTDSSVIQSVLKDFKSTLVTSKKHAVFYAQQIPFFIESLIVLKLLFTSFQALCIFAFKVQLTASSYASARREGVMDVDSIESAVAQTSSTDVSLILCRLNVPMMIAWTIARSGRNAIKLKDLKCFDFDGGYSKSRD
jgi:hypothetical protein